MPAAPRPDMPRFRAEADRPVYWVRVRRSAPARPPHKSRKGGGLSTRSHTEGPRDGLPIPGEVLLPRARPLRTCQDSFH